MKNKHNKYRISDKIYLKEFTPLESKPLTGFTPLENCNKVKGVSLTGFTKAVLRTVSEIPLGQTRSYQWVAKKLDRPKAVRAVGQALKRNPFPLLIPCHRVIGSDGGLGGYSRGRKNKHRLLKLEKEIVRVLVDK